MAGRGPVPKDPGHRRRYNQPARGEWVDLEPLAEPVLEPYDREAMTCKERTWNAWRRDAVTSQYGDADVEAITVLAEEWVWLKAPDRDRAMNQLGLTPKGKRDLRWRTPNEVKTIKAQAAKAPLRRLHVTKEPT